MAIRVAQPCVSLTSSTRKAEPQRLVAGDGGGQGCYHSRRLSMPGTRTNQNQGQGAHRFGAVLMVVEVASLLLLTLTTSTRIFKYRRV